MLSRIASIATLLFITLKITVAAVVVLQRPPSSPNHIPQDYIVTHSKDYNEKGSVAFSQSTNVERPDIYDVKLLQIHVEDVQVPKPMKWHSVMEAVLDEDINQRTNDTYPPSPEVVPHSVLGVRNIGNLPARFHMNIAKPNKKLVTEMPKVKNLSGKYYYLKHGISPKVYVNVRGHSGNFRKGVSSIPSPTIITPPNKFKGTTSGMIQLLEPVNLSDDIPLYEKKLYMKKFDSSRGHTAKNDVGNINHIRTVRTEKEDNDDDVLTTEYSVITSSELPKQIPAPPSRIPILFPVAHTTPVLRSILFEQIT